MNLEQEPVLASLVEFDAIEEIPCEEKLGTVALCASCPLLRLLGDCPKAIRDQYDQPISYINEECDNGIDTISELLLNEPSAVPELSVPEADLLTHETPAPIVKDEPMKIVPDVVKEPVLIAKTEAAIEPDPEAEPLEEIIPAPRQRSYLSLLLDEAITVVVAAERPLVQPAETLEIVEIEPSSEPVYYVETPPDDNVNPVPTPIQIPRITPVNVVEKNDNCQHDESVIEEAEDASDTAMFVDEQILPVEIKADDVIYEPPENINESFVCDTFEIKNMVDATTDDEIALAEEVLLDENTATLHEIVQDDSIDTREVVVLNAASSTSPADLPVDSELLIKPELPIHVLETEPLPEAAYLEESQIVQEDAPEAGLYVHEVIDTPEYQHSLTLRLSCTIGRCARWLGIVALYELELLRH